MLVMFCCNDERGDFAGRVVEVSFGDLARLACTNETGARMEWLGERPMLTRIRIGERTFQYQRERLRCVGNVWWDGAHMRTAEARALVRYLRYRLCWNVEEHATSGPIADLVRIAS